MASSELERAVRVAGEEAALWVGRGRVADYIPALARVDPRRFGLAVATLSGEVVTYGDAEALFSIQSVSKVFLLALALRRYGEEVFRHVGREPSGDPFNSIVQLERERGVPRNPFINAGAIVVSDLVAGARDVEAVVDEILGFVRRVAGDAEIGVDPEVAASEARTGSRNRSLAWFLRDFGTIRRVEETLQVYFHQCAVAMSCVQLARAGVVLASGGQLPSGAKVVSPKVARQMNALMMTCGHYDASGDFAFRVGLPGKSGVGGGILAVAPGQAGIAVWSPGLSRQGNSLAGAKALEVLARETGWSSFSP
jgi:glutaminase